MPDLPPAAGSDSGPITLDRFSQVLDKLYEAALNPDGWEDCLEAIRRELHGNYVSLIVRTVTREDTGLIVSVSEDRRALVQYTPDLAVSPFTGVQPDRLVTNGDVIADAEWRASAYYRDWCAPHDVYHVMAADIGTREGEVYGFRVTRSEQAPPFSAADKELGRRLIPHIKRALNLHQSIHRDRKVLSMYSRAMAQLLVGVVVLDKDCNVIECNPAAKTILEMQDGLRIVGQQLEATYANDNRKLQRMVKDALSHNAGPKMALTEALSVSRPSGQLAWGVVVQSISPDAWTQGKQRPAVAVFVRDSESKSQPPIKLAQQLFQLTPAETMLAIQLANGMSLEEAAEALNIRRNTARAHLRSIFSKTGVRRQMELVRLFLNSVAWLGTKD
ncbi:MAG: helix-turn-helix transcriptional regulator [Proteobacteria bacterium]|nr:helix-turn-helix transcriptional regulator [Pseudomonadota bacterium]MBS0493566.1 helix-turn-helix transcriptional regulator [Pseudomonadota bacterium]